MKKVLLTILVLVCMQSVFGGTKCMYSPDQTYPIGALLNYHASTRQLVIDDGGTYDFDYDFSQTSYEEHLNYPSPGMTYAYIKFTITEGPKTGKTIYILESDDPNYGYENEENDPIWVDFVKSLSKSSSSGETGTLGSTPVNPIVSQNIQTFKLNVFSERVQPRASKKEEKKEGEGKAEQSSLRLLKPNQGGADLSNEFFSIDKADGNNFSARGGYSKTIEHSLGGFSGALSFGGNMIYNYIKLKDNDKGFANLTINVFANKNLTETTEKVRNAGILYNYLGIDNDMSDDDGYAIGFHYSEKLYMGENLLTYGGIYNFAGMGDYSTSYLSLGGMYGMPVGELMSANFELFYTRILLASYDGESVTVDSKNSMNLGAFMSYMVSDAFSLNGGARTTLLVKDYSSFEIYLGSSYWF